MPGRYCSAWSTNRRRLWFVHASLFGSPHRPNVRVAAALPFDIRRWAFGVFFRFFASPSQIAFSLLHFASRLSAMAPRGSRLLARLRRWAAELLLVFLGAYAAFWLTNHQEHLQEAHRRDQILAALERQATADLASANQQRDRQAQIAAEFKRALAAGEMPPLKPFSFNSDYSATDVATLLQSGGYQLLDVNTLVALRQLEGVLRGGINTMQHAQQLSDALIVPNLDQDITFFYDPATKQLRKRFARYTDALESFGTFYNDYINAQTELLNQIRAERARR
jgi:hypothetical protein